MDKPWWPEESNARGVALDGIVKGRSRPSADSGDRQLAGIPKQSQTDYPNEAPQR